MRRLSTFLQWMYSIALLLSLSIPVQAVLRPGVYLSSRAAAPHSVEEIGTGADFIGLASQTEIRTRATGRYGAEGAATDDDFFSFVTRPDIQAPKWSIQVYDEHELAPGYWFVAPYELLGQKERGEDWVGPYIYSGEGDLIWTGTSLFDSFNIFDFRPVEIHGENMFTAIYKRADAGMILDSSYRIRKMVSWPGGYDAANMHEFSVFDNGAKVLVLTRESHLLSRERSKELKYDGRCLVNTNGLLELDITTTPPTTLFNFSLIDHLSLDEVTYPTVPDKKKECEEGWDANHCNAVDRFSNGDYLVSCRHTDTIYKISRQAGSILWRLGGTKSDFKFAGEAKFSRQHHARVLQYNETHTLITLFDNARGEGIQSATHDYTRGLILSLHDGIAEVVAEYPRPDHEYSTSRGSLEILPNGNVFIGWTFHSRISEHSPDGTLLMKAKLPPKMNTYRSYKTPWIGRPVDPPDVSSRAVEASPDDFRTEVYVSWNGATEVVKWNIWRSNAQGKKLGLETSVSKNGFETFAKLDGWVRYVLVEAIDANGESLGKSKVVRTTPPDRDDEDFIEEQEWLETHVPSIRAGNMQEETHETTEDASEDWYGVDSETLGWEGSAPYGSALAAYIGGFCTCLLALVLWWTGLGLKRKFGRREQVYTPVHKDDHEDDVELDESLKPVDR